ncbi:MAG: DUF333 domain-containing protein [Candidatus Micrarchaeota archaeon]|nr:DUF333 domain-containing protein [Candidatus Micrarchaeota archaeon]
MVLISGCTMALPEEATPKNQSNASNLSNQERNGAGAGLANPASAFCSEKGYKNEIRRDASGSAAGFCVFPNGRECEEWAFFRGECTDADSFEMVESPGFTANPKSISYKFYADGRLVLAEKYLNGGNQSTLYAWLKPSDFAAFVKSLEEAGFNELKESYSTCGGNGGPCPTDLPSISLSLLRQGNEKTVYVYAPADRPQNLEKIIINFKKLVESSDFAQVDLSGCKLMQNKAEKKIGCFGCPKGITYPKCTEVPSGKWEKAEEGLGSCAIDAAGGCAYQPPEYLTQKLCEAFGGHWQECGSACRGAPEGTMCTLQCVPYCECGGIAGFGCPEGYFCTDYLPKGAADAMGICKKKS